MGVVAVFVPNTLITLRLLKSIRLCTSDLSHSNNEFKHLSFFIKFPLNVHVLQCVTCHVCRLAIGMKLKRILTVGSLVNDCSFVRNSAVVIYDGHMTFVV